MAQTWNRLSEWDKLLQVGTVGWDCGMFFLSPVPSPNPTKQMNPLEIWWICQPDMSRGVLVEILVKWKETSFSVCLFVFVCFSSPMDIISALYHFQGTFYPLEQLSVHFMLATTLTSQICTDFCILLHWRCQICSISNENAFTH